MVTRRPITSQHAKEVSRRLRSATVGTHSPRTLKAGSPSRRHMNAAGVGFSNSRRQQRATRGFVDNVMTVPSNATNARRTYRDFQQGVRRRSAARMLLLVAICAVLVVGVVGFIGTAAFRLAIDS